MLINRTKTGLGIGTAIMTLCIAGLANGLPSPANAGKGSRYAPFPSFEFYDVDAELRARNIKPDSDYKNAADNKGATAKDLTSNVFVVEQKLGSFLKFAGQRNNVRVIVSPRLRGTIRNTDLPSNLEQMLMQLADTFEFDWYRDANTLYVSDRSENSTKVIALGRNTYTGFRRTLDKLGLSGKGYSIRHVEDSNSVMVTGPASLIAKIEVLVASKAEMNSGPKLIQFGLEK